MDGIRLIQLIQLLEDGDEDEDMEGGRAGDVHQGGDSHSCPSTTCLS